MEPSLKRGDVASDQRITCCADCDAFAKYADQIRGATWERESGLRHFYTVGRHLRASGVGTRCSVPPGFFPNVHDDCSNWLDHLAGVVGRGDRNAVIRAHLASQHLPSWMPSLIQGVDFVRRVGSDAAVTVCAELLAISPQQVYAQLV